MIPLISPMPSPLLSLKLFGYIWYTTLSFHHFFSLLFEPPVSYDFIHQYFRITSLWHKSCNSEHLLLTSSFDCSGNNTIHDPFLTERIATVAVQHHWFGKYHPGHVCPVPFRWLYHNSCLPVKSTGFSWNLKSRQSFNSVFMHIRQKN